MTVDRPVAVGVDITATHHGRPVGHGDRGRHPRPSGPQLATYEIVITDEGGARVCTARLTCMLRA